MALTHEDMDRKLAEHFDYEARDDVEGVLRTLAPDVEHDVVGWPLGPAQNHADIRAFYEALFADLADGKVTSRRRLYGDNFMVDDSIWSGRAPGRPFGFEGQNRPLEFRLLHVFEFNNEGEIRRENVWIDVAAIMRQLAPVEAGIAAA